MAVYCFTQRIQPGKRDEARSIFEEIMCPRRSEYEASRRRLGIRKERVWFQSFPDGEMAVVYWEGDDPGARCNRSPPPTTPSTSGSRSAGGSSTTSSHPRPS